MIKKWHALLCSMLMAFNAPIWAADDLPNPQTAFNFEALQAKSSYDFTQVAENKPNNPPPMPIGNHLNHDKLLEKNTQDDSIKSPSKDDLLRKQKIKPQNTAQDEAELLAKPDQLEKILALNLASYRVEHLPTLRSAYAKVPNHDASLLEWADAMMLAKKDVTKAVRAYRVLLSKFPDNTFIRFQLATLLYQNQEFESAKVQFEKLRAVPNVKKDDLAVFDNFLNAIAKKDQWNFNLGVSFLNDKNLADVADVGTQMILDNGAVLTQMQPKQKGTGLNLNTGIRRQWSFDGGKYTDFNTDISLKYYWNNKAFNELNAYVSSGIGYQNARTDVKVAPYIFKRFYGGGDPKDSTRLKSYTRTLGLTLSGSRWHTPNLKQFGSYSIAHESYTDTGVDRRYGGSSHSIGTSLMYLRGAKQYFGAGVDFSRRNAGDKVNSYNRYNGRVFWGQEWPLGFSTNTSISVAKRKYRDEWLGIIRRNNTEINGNLSIWHKAVHFKGITPRLTFQYHKTKSNIPIFSYSKKTMFLEVDKTF